MTSSLKKRAFSGAAWTLGGYGASQVLRLGSNLILTRLLAQELFGIMALVNVLIIGLTMFSDVGIGASIIQDEKGDNPEFLNTAWTIQVVRGFGLWICACVLAYPFAMFYGEPRLAQVIPVICLVSVISGFDSTSLFTTNRNLAFAKLTMIELIRQFFSIIVIITWAWFSPTIWAIVAGTILSHLIRNILSHVWLDGIPNRFYWDPVMAKRLVRFGRWIFASTAIAFLLQHVDRLIFGKFMTLEKLAIYSIAAMFAMVIDQIYRRMSNQVLFPLYAKLKDLPQEEWQQKVRKMRITLMSVVLPAICALIIFGPYIIKLYPPEYAEAAWMLQLLAAGWIVPMATFHGPVFLAFGDSFTNMKVDAIRAFILVASMIVGGLWYGIPGLIWGIALADAIYYPYIANVYRRHSLWFPSLDVAGIMGCLLVIAVGLYFNGTLHQYLPALS